MASSRNAGRHSALAEHYNEIVALVLVAAALLMSLAVLTSSFDDKSFNGTGFVGLARHNWTGPVGAYCVDLIFQTVGWVYFIVPVLFIVAAWRFFRMEGFTFSVIQVAGYISFVISASSLLSVFGFKGGMLGKFIGVFILQSLFYQAGAVIILLLLFALSTVVVFNFSYISTLESLSMAYTNAYEKFQDWFSKRRAASKLRAEEMRELEELNAEADGKKKTKTVTIRKSEEPFAAEEKKTRRKKTDSTSMEESAIVGDLPFDQLVEEPEVGTRKKRGSKAAPADAPFETGDSEDVSEPDESEIELDLEDAEIFEEHPIEVKAPKAPPKPPQISPDGYALPPSDFLVPAEPVVKPSQEETELITKELEETMEHFNVNGKVQIPLHGPVVTTFPFKPDPGVKYSRVTGLEDDLCLALKAESIRIDRIPGKAFVGIEVPNARRETIQLREIIESNKFQASESMLTLALGKTIDGKEFVSDLAKMPHLLIAGATGAGKSVGVNTLIVSILYKARPDEVKFIMVDPKRLELGVYADIPHLATPIITDPKRAAISLRWAVTEMENRYKTLAGWGVRNIDGFNTEVRRRNAEEQWDDNGEPWKTLPYIVIIIDELADLMMVAGKEVEASITRLAQMARAVGIHLVLATQRPSVDVITGLIKANFPSRISFRVSSKVDSRTIIDANGAERLLGRGDMLFLPPASSQVIRVHGAYVDEKEIHKIVEHIKAQGNPDYDENITKTDEEKEGGGDLPGRSDPLFWDAVKSVVAAKRGSTSLLQRNLRIGYGRAAALLDAMVQAGYIGEMDGTRARPVLDKAYEDLQDMEEMNNEQ